MEIPEPTATWKHQQAGDLVNATPIPETMGRTQAMRLRPAGPDGQDWDMFCVEALLSEVEIRLGMDLQLGSILSFPLQRSHVSSQMGVGKDL